MSTLIIIPCGAAKLWRKGPSLWREITADLAYTGSLFRMNRTYAIRYSDRWLILSARHGLLEPTDLISDYDASFNDASPDTVSAETLRAQISAKGLDRFQRVIALGGEAYRAAISEAFSPFGVEVVFPFAGLELGRSLRAVKRAIDSGTPLPAPDPENGAGSTAQRCGRERPHAQKG